MRILHAPTNIANQAWCIATGQRALGHDVEVWHYGANPFAYPCDRAVAFPPENPGDVFDLMVEALGRFDVFHFHFGRSLIPRETGSIPGLWDLPLYRALGKRVFFTFHGSDVRLKSIHVAENEWSYYKFAEVVCDEDDIAKRLEIIRTYANGMFVCSPVNTRFVPEAAFHPRAIVTEDWPYVGPTRTDDPLVVHIPSARGTKGTDVVQRVVADAQARGLKFEFRILENLPHAEMKRVLADADIVVDNLLLGDYEVTGLEALCLGKTVITRMDEAVFERMGEVPILNANPDSFVEVLEKAVKGSRLRKKLAEEGRQFVEKHHDATVVAGQLIAAYEKPQRPLPLGFPDWASLTDLRKEERLEKKILELQTLLRTRAGEAKPVRPPLGRFARLGAKVDAGIRKLRRR
ncbi:MAG: hypothetical protein ABR548_01590 [Actinomycetota bacterium]|nr:hypothetical protein [Actinomycetota bacterium]